MPSKPHTSCRKGKRVIVTLTNGSRYLDKFVESNQRYITLEQLGNVAIKDIRAFSIYRGQKKGLKMLDKEYS